eukprot:CAMPEP_0181231730 /NCGR_PEP_ID=MMETSP1096-20121128/35286_1 /TAXON_ID=156174 ORGANISM="Chrysochromulina ericina, Strain CCMP281" /NCGR_SAMPLE_ID=MMETSP1096 /ASSEMBLY_ACC=CAM_ASM_000453 /LENGTH=110 /DNA_ID=CAMNT_0023325839 /DNA_START=195 /DNA_END=526 /DNA_ORIENTATION=+
MWLLRKQAAHATSAGQSGGGAPVAQHVAQPGGGATSQSHTSPISSPLASAEPCTGSQASASAVEPAGDGGGVWLEPRAPPQRTSPAAWGEANSGQRDIWRAEGGGCHHSE